MCTDESTNKECDTHNNSNWNGCVCVYVRVIIPPTRLLRCVSPSHSVWPSEEPSSVASQQAVVDGSEVVGG